MSDPLQELAEKLRDEMFSRHMGKMDVCQRVADAFLPILTAAVGTLLQAERAAQRELDAQIPDRWANSKSCEPGQVCTHQRMGAEIAYLIRKATTPEASSALSAVVQRETEKLRELLSRSEVVIARYKMVTLEGYEATETSNLLKQIQAALQ